MKTWGAAGNKSEKPRLVQRQRFSIGVAILLMIALQVWLSGLGQNVPVAVGQSVATRTPTATGLAPKTRTPKPTRTSTPTRPSGSSTATPTVADSPTFTPTSTPTFAATPTPTDSQTPAPTFTETEGPTATPTETETAASTYTETATEPPTAAATDGTTPTETATVDETTTVTPTLTPTETEIITPTLTATLTPTLTPSPEITGTLEISARPSESYVAPGGIVSFTVRIANTDVITTTADLTTTDTNPDSFTSSLDADHWNLIPGQVVTTTLTVSVSSEAQGDIADDTIVHATSGGVEVAKTTVTSRLLYAQFNRALAGVGTSDHYVSPSTQLQMQVGISVNAPLTSTLLMDYLPGGWDVTDAGGGKLSDVDGDSQQIEWNLKNVAAGAVVTRTYTISSPAAITPPPEYSFQTMLTGSGQRFFSPLWSVVLKHPLALAHYRIGWDAPLDRMTFAAKTDETATDIPRFKAFRVRFQVFNDQLGPVGWQPRLEWSTGSDGVFQPVAVGEPKLGDPFYVRPVDDVADGARIPTSEFGTGWDTHVPAEGYVFTAQNPAPILSLDSYSFTEVEFSIRATADAAYQQAYYFRLSDDGRLLGGPLAQIEMETQPVLHLTQPQYKGISPNAAPSAKTKAKAMTQANNTLSYPHGPYSITGSECASCHRSHTGDAGSLLTNPPAQSNVCFTCHDGSNANTDIQRQYTATNVPANNPAANSIYSHPATTPAANPAGGKDEFHNTLNRQSECGDCHDPHSGDSSLATETANGYTVSGALIHISGVGVSGPSRTLVWKDSVTYEYELCYKCHSSYTTLPPSPQETDQSAEFNPANASYHPIESAGKNTTITMTNSLVGTSPYKLWTFGTGDTVRCVNCHGDYRLANPATPPAANARLAPHTSVNTGILMNGLRDRVLKSRLDAYDASDFALCYQCHSEGPFVDTTGNPNVDTDFRFHGFHLNNISDNGSGGTNIDTPGDGQGNAICSECHYQPHGQAQNARGNATGAGLVNFAPDVQRTITGTLEWDPAGKTCTLVCHGADHEAVGYQ